MHQHSHTQHQIKSYVCRGRATSAQKHALQQATQQRRLLSPCKAIEEQWPWARSRKLWVELGCGSGENLLHIARDLPDWACIGVDVYAPGLSRLLLQDTENLANLRLVHGDHKTFFRNCIASSTIDICTLFFPDPWPKVRHHKRRLINRQLLQLLSDRLTTGGELWIATDWHNYAEQIISLLASEPNWQPVHTPPCAKRHTTAFEYRAIQASRRIFEQRWRLVAD